MDEKPSYDNRPSWILVMLGLGMMYISLNTINERKALKEINEKVEILLQHQQQQKAAELRAAPATAPTTRP